MGKGKKIAKGHTEKKETSRKKNNNKKTAASPKKTTKPSSSKGEDSITCRASPSLKGKKCEPPPKAQQEASSSESFSTGSDYVEFLLTYDKNKEFLCSSDSEVDSK
ncbi:hypothetical protein A2U01_0051363 [Trifolium medium]|uniref:Uncharacterized protein n=1 Tax=Trifolium medium TaxID=97028 RepID=A0A392R215_9FABA|nr:hypothetical protein [Trifolium medium]